MLRGTTLELQQQKGTVKLHVLGLWCLPKPVEYLVQAQYIAGVVVQKARSLSHVDGLLLLFVEESRLHVHVVDLPGMMSRNRQQ